MIPRFGKQRRTGVQYRTRPGAYAILLRGEHVLLTQQDGPNGPVPELQLPGGGIDPGESPLAALHREVIEETGWRIGAPQRIGIYRRFAYMPDYDLMAEKICHVFLARPIRPLGAATEPGHSAIWMEARRAVDLLASAGDRAALAAVLR